MANLSSDSQTFTMDDPITQLAELNNTLHQFQTMFASPFSSSLDSLFFHRHQNQQLPEDNSFHQETFLPSNIHDKDESSSRNGTKKRKTLTSSVSTSENSVSDQTLSTVSAQVSTNGTKNSYLRKGKRSKSREEENEREVVHVRVKRGQATDSHSLAERAMGMATMLDEIINYVQSLQKQVEFLSMKLTAASSYYDFNSEADAVDSMQKAKAREAVEMGQGRDGSTVFHSSSWTF
ncbi:hypothetical protein Bca4012_027842 [Brassica carinata]